MADDARMSNELHSLAYVSSAIELFTVDELSALMAGSRLRNRENGITGALLYFDGSFIQVLEGPPQPVQSTFERICASSRHRGTIVLYQEEIAEREFADWHMGFRELDASTYAPLRASLETGSGTAHALLRSFWRDR